MSKRIVYLILISLGLVLIFTFSWLVFIASSEETEDIKIEINQKVKIEDKTEITKPYVVINDVIIPIELSLTPKEQTQGLSGRPFLEFDQGMLFVFTTRAKRSFWMPNMNFPLDIIWILDNEIVGIEANVSNQFDFNQPQMYESPIPVNYVLEVNAGFSERHDFKIGKTVEFSF